MFRLTFTCLYVLAEFALFRWDPDAHVAIFYISKYRKRNTTAIARVVSQERDAIAERAVADGSVDYVVSRGTRRVYSDNSPVLPSATNFSLNINRESHIVCGDEFRNDVIAGNKKCDVSTDAQRINALSIYQAKKVSLAIPVTNRVGGVFLLRDLLASLWSASVPKESVTIYGRRRDISLYAEFCRELTCMSLPEPPVDILNNKSCMGFANMSRVICDNLTEKRFVPQQGEKGTQQLSLKHFGMWRVGLTWDTSHMLYDMITRDSTATYFIRLEQDSLVRSSFLCGIVHYSPIICLLALSSNKRGCGAVAYGMSREVLHQWGISLQSAIYSKPIDDLLCEVSRNFSSHGIRSEMVCTQD